MDQSSMLSRVPDQSSEALCNTTILTVVNVSRPGTPDSMIQYQCTASNVVESPAIAVANVTVHCKSVLLSFHVFFMYVRHVLLQLKAL